MRSSSIVAVVALLLTGPPAFAQGTAQQRAACTSDAWRLCASAIPNVGAITACLRRESANLSPACRTVMNEAQGATRQAAAPRPETPRFAARATPRRLAESRTAARATPRPMASRALAAQATPRFAASRAAPARMAMRRDGRMAMLHRPARHVAGRRRYAGGYGVPGGLGGLGGPQSRSAMRQANYWMRQIGGMMGGMQGMGGMGGMSLDSIRDMRVGDLMNMME
ncbi:hypothetical protein [Methylobacterium sp. JK268]